MLRRCLFLDRDGVVNVDHGYVHRKENFEFIDGIFALCRAVVEEDMLLVIVTNQSGIGRGYFSEEQFRILNSWMLSRFRDEKISITAVYHCPFHPQYGIGGYKRESFNRKPNPGMLLLARDDFDIDLSRSILLGDRHSDVEAGRSAGIGLNILLDSKVEKKDADVVVSDLKDALSIIRGYNRLLYSV